MEKKTIAIGGDHAGYLYKEVAKSWLEAAGYEVLDLGTHSLESVDYPDFVHPVADLIESGKATLGFLFCGSANGVAMTANKHQDIRAAIAWQVDLAELARQHNDANVLAIPCRFVEEQLAIDMIQAFLNTDFEGGRHARRVGKIARC
mgnify:CR=1 FL=1